MRLRTKIGLGFFVVVAVLFLHYCVFDSATWYGESWRGKKMANGKPFNPDRLTCACWDYAVGTRLRISHENHSVVVEVTDRGGKNRWYQFGKTIDLTPAAFSKLAPLKAGSIKIKVRRSD